MHRPRTTLAVAILIFLSFLVATKAAQSVRVPPRLILVLSVDQMRYEYLTRFRQIFKGGFRKLLDQGAVFSNALYRHANSETGPGHSVILSGRHASHSGIVANTWFDPFLRKAINVVDDPVHLPVGGARARRLTGQFHRFHGRRCSETALSQIEGRRGIAQGPLRHPDGWTSW